MSLSKRLADERAIAHDKKHASEKTTKDPVKKTSSKKT